MDQRLPPLPPLTSLRFFAALGIVYYHYTLLGLPAGLTGLGRYTLESVSAITFFFVLSGFVLAYKYGGPLRDFRPRRVWNFLVLRWARLYPVHALTFVIALGVPVVYAQFQAEHVKAYWKALATLTFVQAFIPDPAWNRFNPVSWSLSTEWFFYLTFPLWAWLFARWPGRRGRAPLALAVWAASLAVAWAFRNHPDASWVCYTFPLVRLTDFLIGVLLGLTFAERMARPRLAEPRAGSGQGTALEVAAVAVLAGCVWLYPRLGLPETVRFCAYYTPAVALVLWAFALGRGALSRALSTRAMLYLGELSFSLYLLHSVLQLHYMTAGPLAGVRAWPAGWQWAGLFAVTMAATVLCYQFFETPLRRAVTARLCLAEKARGAAEGAPPAARAAA